MLNYVYGHAGMIVEQIDSEGKVLYLHHDQAGSTRMLTSPTGTIEAVYTYDPYGNQTGHTGTATTPIGYDGQYTNSDTGLIYLRARVYDPATAQFLSRDPLTAVTGEPYTYAGDNPLTFGDPTGLSFGSFLEEVGEGIAGWGDTITFGATKWVREELGINNVLSCSGAYQAGSFGGLITAALIPGGGEAAVGAEGAGSIDEVLAGLRSGQSSNVYEVDSSEEMQNVYEQLSAGGQPATPQGYDGQMVKLSDGTRVGLRNTSSSGCPAIDIHRPGQPGITIHLPRG